MTELIRRISAASNRYGDKLVEFMDEYDLMCLADATKEQLTEFIHKHNL